MRKLKDYPVSLSVISEHPKRANEIFLEARPHKGAYIGVAKLQGSFLCELTGDVFADLEIGEKLTVAPDLQSKLSLPPLNVTKEDGTFLGILPYAEAILPNILISRGIELWCYAEAKEFKGGIPEIVVSIYCEEY